MITAAEQATIREKCGEGAPAQGGIALRGRDGVLLCTAPQARAASDGQVTLQAAHLAERLREPGPRHRPVAPRGGRTRHDETTGLLTSVPDGVAALAVAALEVGPART